MLAEDTKGNLFDNLNADVDAWAQKNGSSKLPANSRAGESEPLYHSENLREAAQRPDAPGWVTDGWRTVAEAIDADYAGVGWGLLDPQRCIL